MDAGHFPLLKADWDDTSGATWGEFGDQDPSPAFAADAAVADVVLTQGGAHTAAAALPEASGGNGALSYSVAGLPSGVSLNAQRKITGTPTAPQAKTPVTYTAADTDDDTDTLTFNVGVRPEAVADLTGAAGNGAARLSWTAIAGVDGWEYLRNEKDSTANTAWAAISGSGAAPATR